MTAMFDARIHQMAIELRKMQPGELDLVALGELHVETCRLLRGDMAAEGEDAAVDPYVRAFGLPQETHEG